MATIFVWGCIAFATYVFFYVIFPTVKYLRKCKSTSTILNRGFKPMYEKFNPIFGHSLLHPGPTEKGLMENIRVMTSVSNRAYLFYILSWKPSLILSHPDLVKKILKSVNFKPMEIFGYLFFKEWMGDGLLLSQGAKWFRNRKLLTSAFHFNILKPYVKIYNTSVEKLLYLIAEASDKCQSVEICTPLARCTFDIILKCAFSSADEFEQGKPSPYADAVMSLGGLVIERAYSPWLFPDTIFFLTKRGRKFKAFRELSYNKAMEVITERRKALQNGNKDDGSSRKCMDFLDILLLAKDEDGKSLTDKEIREEVETFMFAGHETTKSGISFILYNLARHPEIQQRARTEVQTLLEGRDSDEILWEDLSNMPYLTQCIKESLRLHPPGSGVARKTTEPLKLDGHEVPVGTHLVVSIWNVHHNPEVWGDDHMTYDPERFSEDSITKMDSHAFIPFSAGPRNCIGQIFAMNEMKVIVARIISRFELMLDETVKVELKESIVLETTNGIHIKFRRL